MAGWTRDQSAQPIGQPSAPRNKTPAFAFLPLPCFCFCLYLFRAGFTRRDAGGVGEQDIPGGWGAAPAQPPLSSAESTTTPSLLRWRWRSTWGDRAHNRDASMEMVRLARHFRPAGPGGHVSNCLPTRRVPLGSVHLPSQRWSDCPSQSSPGRAVMLN